MFTQAENTRGVDTHSERQTSNGKQRDTARCTNATRRRVTRDTLADTLSCDHHACVATQETPTMLRNHQRRQDAGGRQRQGRKVASGKGSRPEPKERRRGYNSVPGASHRASSKLARRLLLRGGAIYYFLLTFFSIVFSVDLEALGRTSCRVLRLS